MGRPIQRGLILTDIQRLPDRVTISTGRLALALRRRIGRSEEHTSELQSQSNLVCRLLLEKKKKKQKPDERHRHGPDHHPASWLLDLPRLEVPPRQCFEVGGVDAHGNVTSSGGARPSAASV